MNDLKITPEILLRAYAGGIFPMSEDRDDDALFWVDPDERGIIPLKTIHIPRSLAKKVRQDRFKVTLNQNFSAVLQACAAPALGRESTWINNPIQALYTDLYHMGHAHSIECWEDDHLVGGLYGVSLCGAFFGESMFHKQTDASKVALIHLVARLKAGGFALLDTQFITGHLKQFGAINIPRSEYHARLDNAMQCVHANIKSLNQPSMTGTGALQLITQTS